VPVARLQDSTLALATELRDLALRLAPSLAELPRGTPVAKTVAGRKYWYRQSRGGGLEHQRYLGPETPELLAELAAAERRAEELAPEIAHLERLHDMAVAGGVLADSAAATRILELLSGARLFERGGVLVGTRAFLAYGALLGFRPSAAARTEDFDVAFDLALVLPREPAEDLPARLAEFSPPFLAVPELDPRHPSTSFKLRGRALRVDFLTPLRGRERTRPIALPAFGVAATPLRLLDFLIDEPLWAVAYGTRPVLVRLPDPARFALHKLWLAGQRPAAEAARARKDLAQASELLDLLHEDRPRDLTRAARALARHPGQLRAARSQANRLDAALRDLTRRLLASG
jgi:hypothetical protein